MIRILNLMSFIKEHGDVINSIGHRNYIMPSRKANDLQTRK